MQWEFRKVLESIESYKKNYLGFLHQVEKGTAGVLTILVRELEIIMGDPKQSKVAKVLAMRFAKQIMILGRQDVSLELTKLVPHILKICSHRLESDSQDRGETLFYDDDQYKNGTQQQKAQLEIYGSTYFTLCLESIYHWARWVPQEESGKQSLYLKGYNTLIERGVKFQPIFHYYKNSDTQKFKNTYRVQFFAQSSFDVNSYEESLRQSAMSEAPKIEIIPSKFHNIKRVEQVKKNLQLLSVKNRYNKNSDQRKSLNNEINELYRRVTEIHESNYPKSSTSIGNKKMTPQKKMEKNWLDNFMILYGMYKANKITLEEFFERNSEAYQEISITEPDEVCATEQQLINLASDGFRKKNIALKKESIGQRDKYENMLQEEEDRHRRESQNFIRNLQNKDQEIWQIKQMHKKELESIKKQYEQRISILKAGIADRNLQRQNQTLSMIQKQNKTLKMRILQMQASQQEQNSMERKELDFMIEQMKREIDNLATENASLQNQYRLLDQQNEDQKIRRIHELEQMLAKKSSNNKKSEEKVSVQKNDKKENNLQNQIFVLKKSLADERQNFGLQTKRLKDKIDNLEREKEDLKSDLFHLQKKYDLKELQSAELQEQINLCRLMEKEANIMLQNYETEKNDPQFQNYPLNSPPNYKEKKQPKQPKVYSFEMKKYEKFRNSFNGQKERFFRFARCCLKKKDLLLKENQLEVGIITQYFSIKELKFTLFFTNISDFQVDNFQIYFQHPQTIQVKATSTFIFCIQPKEQEKVTVRCQTNLPTKQKFEPVYLIIKFKKKERSYEYSIALPNILYKAFELHKKEEKSILMKNNREAISLSYSKNMISDEKILLTYFPPLTKLHEKVYVCEISQKQSNFRAELKLELSGENFLILHITPISQNPSMNFGILSDSQKKMIEELLAFFQFAFRK